MDPPMQWASAAHAGREHQPERGERRRRSDEAEAGVGYLHPVGLLQTVHASAGTVGCPKQREQAGEAAAYRALAIPRLPAEVGMRSSGRPSVV